MGAWMSWLILLQLSSAAVHGFEGGAGFDGWYQPVPHWPVDIITDVINDLGVRILQQYTSHGNVAFSPTGVGFVLAALYEGSAGRGRQQIADALGLPRDLDVTRIGYRDIHRRLRTYLNADGFLGGLTLNQENTKLRPEYEDVLRFYGFDLSIPEEPANETTTVSSVTEGPVTVILDETTVQTISDSTKDTTIMTTPSVEMPETTLNPIDIQGRMTQTTIGSTVQTTMETVQTTTETVKEATSMVSTASSPDSMTFTVRTKPSTVTTIGTIGTSEGHEESETTTGTMTTDTASTVQPSSSEGSATTSMSIEPGVTSTIAVPTSTPSEPTSTVAEAGSTEPITIIDMAESSPATEPFTTTLSTMMDTLITGTNPPVSVTEASGGTTVGPVADENTVSTTASNNRSISDGETGSSSDSPVTTVATGETGSTEQQLTTEPATVNRRKRGARSPRGFFSSYLDEGIWMQDLGIWKPYSTSLNEASVRDSTEISFLVNGCDVSSVTASRYFAVLPFAYFPSLHAVALEFPLDNPRYSILLMMSTDRRDTYKLARDLGGKPLRLLRKQLQSTWVRATIPSFMLRGFVTLTSYLQRLGIRDVFEPRAADLSPMTPDLGVYARDVQQSIGVNIRNYMKPDRTHSRNGLFERAGPVPFTVVHPFLYFIVDVETSVTLIAGRVNDPLNSRIV